MTDLVIKGWRKIPAIAKLVQAAAPDYKRTTVRLWPAESVTLHDLNWSGGTKSSYVGLTLQGERLGDTTKHEMQFMPRAEGETLPIPEGCCVIRHGFFCGKVSQLYIYARPDTLRLLEAPNA